MYSTINDVYADYVDRAGTDEILSRDEFRQFITGRYEDIDEAFWDALPVWVWGTEPRPSDGADLAQPR